MLSGTAPLPRSPAIGSPGWHRRLRSARAKVRKRVKASRRGLGDVPRKGLLWISQHHTAPQYRELQLSRMSESWANNGSWAYWHGAPWRQRGPKPNGKVKGDGNKDKDQPSQPIFPAYDNKKGGAAVGQKALETDLVRVARGLLGKESPKGPEPDPQDREQGAQDPGRLRREKAAVGRMGETAQAVLHGRTTATQQQFRGLEQRAGGSTAAAGTGSCGSQADRCWSVQCRNGSQHCGDGRAVCGLDGRGGALSWWGGNERRGSAEGFTGSQRRAPDYAICRQSLPALSVPGQSCSFACEQGARRHGRGCDFPFATLPASQASGCSGLPGCRPEPNAITHCACRSLPGDCAVESRAGCIASKYLLAWQAEDGCTRVLERSGQAIRACGEKGDYARTEQSGGIAGHGDAAALWGSHGQRGGEYGPTSARERKYGGDEGPEPAAHQQRLPSTRPWTEPSYTVLWDSNIVKAADADGLPCVPLASGWSGVKTGGSAA